MTYQVNSIVSDIMSIIPNRDIELLAALLRYRYLTGDQIHGLFFSGKSRAARHKVTKRLEDRKLLHQKAFPRIPGGSYGNLYYLSDKGARFLAEEWEILDIGYKKIIYPIKSINHFYHRKRMIDFWIELDKDLETCPYNLKTMLVDYERVTRDGEQVVKTHIEDGDISIIPDLIFILTNADRTGERVFMVEIDTGKETIGGRFRTGKASTVIDKYRAYNGLQATLNWKRHIDTTAEVFEVLTVTETVKHIDSIREQAKHIIEHRKLFHFSTHELIEKHGIVRDKNWICLETGSSGRKLLG